MALFRKSDIILIAAAVVAAIVLFFVTRSGGDGAFAEVRRNGQHVATLPLGTDAVVELGGNTVEVLCGEVRMIYADCADGLCMNQAAVSRNGESIVCLPNRVTVTVVSQTSGDYDMVVG